VGTYMSAHIEVDYGKKKPPFSDPEQIFSLTEASFSFDRRYEVFDALGGGREVFYAEEDRDPKRRPLFSPRGMASPCSLAAAHEYFYLIRERGDVPDSNFWPSRRCVTPRVASAWLRSKGSCQAEVLQWFNGRRTWQVVSDPMNRAASWLRLGEFDKALAHHRVNLKRMPACYEAVRAAMNVMARRHGESRVRLVLWFS
jgi:hypothetical protein